MVSDLFAALHMMPLLTVYADRLELPREDSSQSTIMPTVYRHIHTTYFTTSRVARRKQRSVDSIFTSPKVKAHACTLMFLSDQRLGEEAARMRPGHGGRGTWNKDKVDEE